MRGWGAAEQRLEKAARLGARDLRATAAIGVVLRDQGFAGAAATGLILQLIEVGAHARDLRVEGRALGGRLWPEEDEVRAVAAERMGVSGCAI